MRKELCALLSLSLLAVPPSLEARSLDFTFEGTASGTAGTRTFTNADLRIDVIVDTSQNYQFINSLGHLIVSTAYSPTTLQIQGIGQGRITYDRRIFCNKANNGLGVTGPTEGDLIDIGNPIFASYDLDRPFGPVFQASPWAWGQFKNTLTDLGPVTLSSLRDVTFTATPEPGMACLGMAGASILLARRRRVQSP